MNKKILLLSVFGMFLLLATMGFGSAHNSGYYPSGKYNSYSYMSSRDYGYHGGPSYSKTTSFDKYTTEGWSHGQYVKSTHYVKTTKESPQNYGYGYVYQGYENHPYKNYYNYGHSYPKKYYHFNYHPGYGYY